MYSDEEFGFSFSYPHDWDLFTPEVEIVDNIETLPFGEAGIEIVVTSPDGNSMATFSAGRLDLTSEEIDGRMNQMRRMMTGFPYESVEEENFEVSRVPAIRWRIVTAGRLQEMVIAVKGDTWYTLVTVVLDDYPEETFGRIIASFSIEG